MCPAPSPCTSASRSIARARPSAARCIWTASNRACSRDGRSCSSRSSERWRTPNNPRRRTDEQSCIQHHGGDRGRRRVSACAHRRNPRREWRDCVELAADDVDRHGWHVDRHRRLARVRGGEHRLDDKPRGAGDADAGTSEARRVVRAGVRRHRRPPRRSELPPAVRLDRVQRCSRQGHEQRPDPAPTRRLRRARHRRQRPGEVAAYGLHDHLPRRCRRRRRRSERSSSASAVRAPCTTASSSASRTTASSST
jgi:hypothetical protein